MPLFGHAAWHILPLQHKASLWSTQKQIINLEKLEDFVSFVPLLGVRGVWRWMKNTCLCFLYWCIDWSLNWYPIVFAARLPASLSISATERGMMLHLLLDLYRLLCLTFTCCFIVSVITSFISHFAPRVTLLPVFISVILSPRIALLSHTHLPFFSLSNTLAYSPLYLEWMQGRVCSSIWPVKFQQWERGWCVAF